MSRESARKDTVGMKEKLLENLLASERRFLHGQDDFPLFFIFRIDIIS